MTFQQDNGDPLALDPYSPSFPTRAPDPKDRKPLALDPYGPITPQLAPEPEDPDA